jgi:hypothetical protein
VFISWFYEEAARIDFLPAAALFVVVIPLKHIYVTCYYLRLRKRSLANDTNLSSISFSDASW